MKARKSTSEPDLGKTNGAPTPLAYDLIRSWAVAYGIAAAVAISLFAGSLPFFLSHYLGSPSCDMNIAYRHFLSFGTRWLRQGVWPQWNPHIFCGTPFLPGTCGAMLSPLNLPCLLALPQPLSINLAILIHAIVLATGGVYWARQYGLGPIGGALAGCLCVAGSAFANRVFAGHFTIVSTMAWIPWLLALHEQILRGHRRSALPLGVVAALMVYSGHLQLCYYAAVLSALMYVVALISQTRTERSAWFLQTLKLYSFALAVAFTFVGLLYALFARLSSPVLRLLSGFDDYFSWLVTLLPMLTGMALISLPIETGVYPASPAHPVWVAMHLLSLELLLAWLPFGKLRHAFLVFFSRGTTGAAFARRGAER